MTSYCSFTKLMKKAEFRNKVYEYLANADPLFLHSLCPDENPTEPRWYSPDEFKNSRELK